MKYRNFIRQYLGRTEAGNNVAYACVVFMRIEYEDGSISCPLVMSKARVAPLSGLTVPRLELLACLLLSKIVLFLRPHFQNMNVIAWTDSQTALHWISGENKIWPIFVQNRVLEIRSNLSGVERKHVPSHQNPADLPSRGASSSTSLLSNDNWWNGPEFFGLELATGRSKNIRKFRRAMKSRQMSNFRNKFVWCHPTKIQAIHHC